MTSRRVVGLRERLSRAGVGGPVIQPDAASDPSLFDDALDRALRTFQQNRGLMVDGVLGPETERVLTEAQYSLGDRPLHYNAEHPLRGDDVVQLQTNLSGLGFYYGHLNGVFQRKTHYAVVELQENLGLEPTGVVELNTIAALARINKNITSAKAYSLRDFHRLEQATQALRQHGVILVPGTASRQMVASNAPADFAAQGDRITTDIATRTYALLDNLGARPVLVSPTSGDPIDERVTRRADSVDLAVAEHPHALVVSLHCDWNGSPAASGVATYFWGDQDRHESYSPIGEVAAGNLLKELVARTGAQDLGCHPRQWDVLRSSGVPTVWVDLGYLSNPDDQSLLESPEHRERLAESLLCGLQRVYMQSMDTVATGSMSLADIVAYYER